MDVSSYTASTSRFSFSTVRSANRFSRRSIIVTPFLLRPASTRTYIYDDDRVDKPPVDHFAGDRVHVVTRHHNTAIANTVDHFFSTQVQLSSVRQNISRKFLNRSKIRNHLFGAFRRLLTRGFSLLFFFGKKSCKGGKYRMNNCVWPRHR